MGLKFDRRGELRASEQVRLQRESDRKLIVIFYVKITFYLDWIKTEKREIFSQNLRSEKQTDCSQKIQQILPVMPSRKNPVKRIESISLKITHRSHYKLAWLHSI